MKTPAGVAIAAIVLLLLTIFGFLCTLLSSAAMFVNRYPLIPRSPGILAVAGIINLLLLCFLIFCFWTAAGLFRLRSAARIRMIVVGFLTAVVTGLIGVELVHLHTLVPAGLTVPGEQLPAAAVVMIVAFVYFAAALVGIWWVAYFSSTHVRQVFDRAALERATSGQSRDSKVNATSLP